MTVSAYVPLARKWRPHSFHDLVGQDEIVKALTSGIESNRLAAAYLFAGPRGVGKTTSARLLAAAINCHSADNPVATPCGKCASCQEVFEGRSMDALEIDGATHGKVDQARELIEMVAFAPARDRKRIFIIDEVHAISTAAFQALLKTLEEPPPHAVFILATTERHKIPATILSRCQRFDFRRLTDAEVVARLAEIARREGFRLEGADERQPGAPWIEKAALEALAAAATGSLRDGLSLLDQVAVRGSGEVSALDVAALLGTPDRSALAGLFSLVLAGDRAQVLARCADLENSGIDPRAALRDLIGLARLLLRISAGLPSATQALVSDAARQTLEALAKGTPYPSLLRLLSMLSEAEALLRRSDNPGLAFELTLLRLAELPRLTSLEDLLCGKAVLAGPVAIPAAPGPARPKPQETAADSREEPPVPEFLGLAPLELEPVPPADPAAGYRAEIEKRHAHLGAALEEVSIRIEGREIRFYLDPPNPVLERRLGESSMKKILEEAATAVLGKGYRITIESAEPAAGDLKSAASASDPATLEKEHLRKLAEKDERVQKILDLFDGELLDVRRDTPRPENK
jgi:DNA polymerase-3 subunit gamma/tau